MHANDLETLPAAYLLAKELHSRLVYDAHELYAEFDPDPPRIARRRARPDRAQARAARRRRRDGQRADRRGAPPPARRRADRRPERARARRRASRRSPPTGRCAPSTRARSEPGRPLEDLLEAIRRAPSVRLTLRVEPLDARSARARAAAPTSRPRDVQDPVPPTRSSTALHGHHVGLLFDRPLTRNAELSAPNKLFEYLMAGLAVVAPDLPGLRWLAEEELGVLFEAGSPESFGPALESLAADPERARAAAGERAPRGGRALQRRGAARRARAGVGRDCGPCVASSRTSSWTQPTAKRCRSTRTSATVTRSSSGTLRGESGRAYPIRDGIPRFVDVEDAGQAQTQSSFGFKWTKRDSFGSEGMQKELHGWLLDRYGFASGDEMRDVLRVARAHARRGLRRGLRDVRVDARGLERDGPSGSARDISRRDRRRARAPRASSAARPSSRPTSLDLPFRPESFDVVFSEGVLHHTPSTERALKRSSRCSRPGGELMIYVYAARRRSASSPTTTCATGSPT